ncbi:hypothetical protein HDU82_007565 [Entophlyctis luteolus]|nr:hypothetical protein HDU82_007565 [Entophlyctis luteolus]
MLQRLVEVSHCFEIRSSKDIDPTTTQLDGIILPGGESTAMGTLLGRDPALRDFLRSWVQQGKPIWGTCAGLILLSDAVAPAGNGDDGRVRIGGLHVTTLRNAFGRQSASFEAPVLLRELLPSVGDAAADGSLFPGVFIRAPIIERVDTDGGVQVLATVEGCLDGDTVARDVVVAVRQGNMLGSSFHPELTSDPRFHLFFINICLQAKKAG